MGKSDEPQATAHDHGPPYLLDAPDIAKSDAKDNRGTVLTCTDT